jgi:hypothetical protein
MSSRTRFKEGWAKAIAIIMIVGGVVVPATSVVASTSQPRDNNANSILWGGCYTKVECQQKMLHGDGHNSAANIQHIYFSEGRGITMANFMSGDTVDGTVYKDGRVMVGNKVVATNSASIGRDKMTGSTKSGSVWMTSNQGAFLSNSIPAWVNMQGGTFHYLVIKSCGNAGVGKPTSKPTPTPTPKPTPTPSHTPSPTPTPSHTPTPTPSPSPSPSPSPTPGTFACVELIPKQVGGSTFSFTIKPSTTGNVKVTGYRFTFSDNTPVVDQTSNTVNHDVTNGTLTVNGQVKTTAGISEISDACSATVNVTTPTPSPSPSITPSPTPTPTGQVLGASLPATGPETVFGGIAGLTGIGLASRAYLRSRKGLLDAMRRKRTK